MTQEVKQTPSDGGSCVHRKKTTKVKVKWSKKKDEEEEKVKTVQVGRLPSVFADVITSLKSHKDRKLDKELHDIDLRKRSREVEYFLSQRAFFLSKVFTANNELRFSRHKNRNEDRAQSCPISDRTAVTPTVTPVVTPSVTVTVTTTVTPSRPSPTRASSPRRAQKTPPSHSQRSASSSRDQPVLRLRDLLFLEESREPPTPNRHRILQARARMFPRHRGHPGDRPRPSTAPRPSPRPQEVQLPAIGGGDSRRGSKVAVRRAQSDGVLIRVTDVTDADDFTSMDHPDTTSRNVGITDVNPSRMSRPAPGGVTACDVVNVTSPSSDALTVMSPACDAVPVMSPMRSTTPRLLVTPHPSAPRVSWSDSVIEVKPRDHPRSQVKDPHPQKVLTPSECSPTATTPGDKQEKLLQRILLTIPPDVLTKAMSGSGSGLSALMGHNQKRLALLQRERRVVQGLGKTDRRFADLVDILKD